MGGLGPEGFDGCHVFFFDGERLALVWFGSWEGGLLENDCLLLDWEIRRLFVVVGLDGEWDCGLMTDNRFFRDG